MKKTIAVIFSFLIAALALPALASAATQPISDFETGLDGWNNGSIVAGSNSAGAMRLHNNANDSAGATKFINSKILAGFSNLEMDINLNGNYIQGGDASACVFDQGGWKYISIKDYVQNGLNGWQHANIPLSAFLNLDANQGIASMTIRFWNQASGNYDIDNIRLSNSGGSTVPPVSSDVIANFDSSPNGFDRGTVSSGSLMLTNPPNSDASTKKIINTTLLQGYSTLEFDINLNGKNLLEGDASAIIFDQSGPKFVSIKNRVENGKNGWQHVKIPLSAFLGLNVNNGIASISFRFWNYTAGTYNLDNIVLSNTDNVTPPITPAAPTNLTANVSANSITLAWSGSAQQYIVFRNNNEIARTSQLNFVDSNLSAGNYTYFVKAANDSAISDPSKSVTAVVTAPDPATAWQVKSIDSQVMSKYWAISDDNQIRHLVEADKALGAKQIAVSINYDNYTLLKKWADIIHSEGLNVWFRGHWNDWDSWEKENIKSGIKANEYLARTKQFITSHPELFRAGDAFTMCVESENAAWWTGIDNGPFNGWEDWRSFTRNQVLMSNDAFAEIGLGGKVHTNWINMNGWVAWEAMDQYTVNVIGQLTLDHIIDWTDDTNTYVNSLFGGNTSNGFKGYDDYYNKWHVPMMAGEWGYSTFNQNMDPNQQKELAAAVFAGFAQRSYIIGVNYWIDVGHASRLFDTPNLLDYQRRPIADVIDQYFT